MTAQPRVPSVRRLRKPAWHKWLDEPDIEVDGGAELLEALARSVGNRTRDVLSANADVTLSAPALANGILPVMRGDRLWQCSARDRVLLCSLDPNSQRALLEFVLAGPGSANPTAVERTIVSETVERLLSRSAEERWLESSAWESHAGAVWRCNVDISDAAATATLRLATNALAVTRIEKRAHLGDVPLQLRARLTPLRATLGGLACWKTGSTLKLAEAASELEAELWLDRRVIARGTLGHADGQRAVRLHGGNSARQ